jgi:hypothetical protein
MRQLLALAAIVVLLGACSDPNPFGSDTASTDDAGKDKAAAADKAPAEPKRVVIARLANDRNDAEPPLKTETKTASKNSKASRSDPRALARMTPASRGDDRDAARDADRATEPEADGDRMPAADAEFMAYMAGKKVKRKRRAKVRRRPAPKPRKAVKIGEYELDKIAPGAGPGRRAGKIDDAFSADRDFIKVLMTDQKPVHRRHRRVKKRKRVVARPSPRKRTTHTKARTIRVARRTRKAAPAAKRAAKRVAKRPARSKPKRTPRSLATLAGGEAADREVLRVLGGK